MKNILVVFIGSGLGGVIRMALFNVVENWLGQKFPFGTVIVNVLACLGLGFFIGLVTNKANFSEGVQLFWTIGFFGGFSTFSAFSSDALGFLQKGQHSMFLLYVFGSVLLSFLAMAAGLQLGKQFF